MIARGDLVSDQARETALRYARNHIPVFPCRPDTKQPYTPNGFHDATTDEVTIRAWWKRWPLAHVAIPTGQKSRRVILDLDNKTGEYEGQRSLDLLEAQYGQLPHTPQVITPSGGTHYVFTAPVGTRVPCSAGKLGAGLDVRGDGGYVIIPGSKGYEWDLAAHPQDVKPAPLPDWLLRKILEGTPRPTRSESTDSVPQGGRNAYLTSVGGGVRRAGCDEEEIYAVLVIRNRNVCTPPLPDDEVREIARSLARYEPSDVPRVPALTRTEQQLRAAHRLQSATTRALAHSRARKLVPVATRLASEIKRQKDLGVPSVTEDGLRAISKGGIGGRKFDEHGQPTDEWDITETTVRNHLDELRGYAEHIPGFRAEKRPVNYPRRGGVDEETGEVVMIDDYRDTWLYDFDGDAADLVNLLPDLPYPPDMRGKCSKCGHEKKSKTVEYCPNCEEVKVVPKEGVGQVLTPIGKESMAKPMGASADPTSAPTLEDWERLYARAEGSDQAEKAFAEPETHVFTGGQTLPHPPEEAAKPSCNSQYGECLQPGYCTKRGRCAWSPLAPTTATNHNQPGGSPNG